jgi:mono/diheme cytochrome c family protein
MGLSLRIGLRASVLGVLAAGSVTLLSACGGTSAGDANLVAGKQLFAEKCGACHALNRAGTKGLAGPNLDEAFQQALADGIPRSGIRGVIYAQILYPGDFEAEGGKRADDSGAMPAKLVTGEDAQNVAAYVASVAAAGGKDTGRLADAVKPATSNKPIAAKNGVLQMPANPDGQLAYASKQATAEAGQLEIDSKNDANIAHDIAIEGNGVSEKGETVQDGGVSKIDVDLKPGEYTYYCTLPGHRAGGMEGKLTVK